jgi:hypothetical protein
MTVQDPIVPSQLGEFLRTPEQEAELLEIGERALKPKRQPTLADFQFRQLTDADIDAGYGTLEVARGFGEEIQPEAEDAPYLGMGFSLGKMLDVTAAHARMRRGKASLEDEREVFRWMIEEARTKTRGGSFADILKQFGTSGVEILGGAGVAKAGAVVARKGLDFALKKSVKEAAEKALQRKSEQISGELMIETGIDASAGAAMKEAGKAVGKGAAVLGTTFGLQEAIPQAAGMEGGAWTAQAVRSVFGEQLTDAEVDQIVTAKDGALAVMLEKGGGLVEGAMRQAIQMGTEGLGYGLAKLPPFAQVDYVMAGLFSRLSGRASKVGWIEAAREAAMFAGPGGEIAEEYAAEVLTASIFGDKTIVEAVADVTKILPELLAAASVPGAAGALVGRAKGKLRDMLQPSGPKVSTAPVAQEGGVSAQAAPEAQAEGAAAVEAPTIAPEESAADLERFNRQTGAAFSIGTADRLDEFASQKLGGRFNLRVGVFVPEEGADLENLPAAFFAGGDRAYVVRGQPGLQGAVIEEGIHAYIDQQPAERKDDLRQALREISPEFMDKVAAFTMSQPLYKNASPELLREEMAANAGTLLGNLTPYLLTPQGKADFELAYGKQPGPFKRALGALYDWIQGQIRLLPQRKRALARARLRVARGEGDPALVAQRVLEALGEIRAVRPQPGDATSAAHVSGVVTRRGDTPLGTDAGSGPTADVEAIVAPRPPKTPADRRANRAARKARAAERVAQTAAETEAKKAADDRRAARAQRRGRRPARHRRGAAARAGPGDAVRGAGAHCAPGAHPAHGRRARCRGGLTIELARLVRHAREGSARPLRRGRRPLPRDPVCHEPGHRRGRQRLAGAQGVRATVGWGPVRGIPAGRGAQLGARAGPRRPARPEDLAVRRGEQGRRGGDRRRPPHSAAPVQHEQPDARTSG